jgi:hypothetical protein
LFSCLSIVCVVSRLADLMEQHQEELATIESIDSGAVYTLALKTHVGMSIQTFRYFAGWCDKMQVLFSFLLIVFVRLCVFLQSDVTSCVCFCR